MLLPLHSIRISQELTIDRSDGKSLTLDEYMKLGHEYWQAFAEGKLKS